MFSISHEVLCCLAGIFYCGRIFNIVGFVTMELLDKMENDNEKSAEEIAQEYLAKHKILELFENLTANLVFERPGKYLLTALLWYIYWYIYIIKIL